MTHVNHPGLDAPVRTKPFPQWPRPPQGLDERLSELLYSGHWWQSGGGAAEELESWLTAQYKAVGSVAVANGTVALELSLRALGIGPGDEVLVPATTFISTASAVAMTGAVPVPVDVDAGNWCIDTSQAEAAISSRTRALIVVHLAGRPADLMSAKQLCDRHALALVEDSAQAISASRLGQRVGTVGDVTTLSFQAGKLLPGGDGGAVVVRTDNSLVRRLELLANCGRPRGSGSYAHMLVATNARITEFAAVTILAHTPGYETLWALRQKHAADLHERLAEIDPSMVLSLEADVTRHDWYMFMLRLPEAIRDHGFRNSWMVDTLQSQGIPAAVMFPSWHSVPAFHDITAHTPVADVVGRQGVWLHHRLLLDSEAPADIAQAVTRAIAAASTRAERVDR